VGDCARLKGLPTRLLGGLRATAEGFLVPMIFVISLALTHPTYGWAAKCFSQSRVVSDNEYILTALLAAGRHPQMKLDVADLESARSYVVENPNCCAVLQSDHPFYGDWLSRLFGTYGAAVEVIAPYGGSLEEDLGKSYEAYFFFDVCGKLVDTMGIAK
jgi:hypothetical protein